jgi:hypothetical protein
MVMAHRLLLIAFVLVPLAGCDQLGIESASVTAARQEADGKAVGAACRHAGRAIEDCFALNRRVDKAAIYAGWREMDDYMRENKMDTVSPVLAAGGSTHPDADADAAPADDAASRTVRSDKAEAKAGDAKADRAARPDKPAKADDAAKVANVAAREGGERPGKDAVPH